MLKLISESQPGAYGPMDFLFDTNAEDVMVAVDIRDYDGPLNPQLIGAQVLVSYPDDYAWMFGLTTQPPNYFGYLRIFTRYEDYCRWVCLNSEIS